VLRDHDALVRTIAREFYAPGQALEDLEQEGRVGLWTAARDFEPARGVPFAAFARVCIRRHVVAAVQRANRHKHAMLSGAERFERPVRGHGGRLVRDVVAARAAGEADDPLRVTLTRESLEAVTAMLPALSARERRALALVADGHSYASAAEHAGGTVGGVASAVQRARRKLAAAAYLGAAAVAWLAAGPADCAGACLG
jgi:RNA polymerase sporulation-specific sigma factor